MYEQREKPKEKVKVNNRPDTRSVVTNRVRHLHDHDDIRGDFLGRAANGVFNGLLQRQPKGRVRPIVPDDFESQSSTIQRAAMAVTAAEMLALASRLVAALVTGGTLSKSLQELNKSPEFEQMTSVQKMTVYSVLYKVANQPKPNNTETLPAEFDAHSTTGGSEITEQGVTNTSQPLTDQAILDLLGPIPASEDKTLVGNTHLPIVDDFGLGRVYSQGGRNESVLKAESKALDGSADTIVSSSSQEAIGNASTTQVGHVAPNKTISASSPGEIAWGFGDLSKRQQGILDQLPDTLSSTTFHKKNVGVTDLAAMTARTGDEFALFTNGSQRLVVRGNPNGVPMTRSELKSLSDRGYKWSGHSHPGTSDLVLDASGIPGDRLVLDIFKQEQSLILNSAGKRNLFNMSDNIRIE